MPKTTVEHVPSPMEQWAGLWTLRFYRGPLWVEVNVSKDTALHAWETIAQSVVDNLKAMEEHLGT